MAPTRPARPSTAGSTPGNVYRGQVGLDRPGARQLPTPISQADQLPRKNGPRPQGHKRAPLAPVQPQKDITARIQTTRSNSAASGPPTQGPLLRKLASLATQALQRWLRPFVAAALWLVLLSWQRRCCSWALWMPCPPLGEHCLQERRNKKATTKTAAFT